MKLKLYPLKFNPIYKEKIWGGQNLRKLFSKKLPPGKKIGESWEISACGNDLSLVSNGDLKGKTLHELIAAFKDKLLGTKVYNPRYPAFPLLVKLLDAQERLSVQVHPDDKYAREKAGKYNGKTEAWYILAASAAAKIVYGFKPSMSKKTVIKNIRQNKIEACLNKTKVKPGEVIFIPAGTVHAILPKLVIMEVQQSSDITYRLFDWDRVGKNGKSRELHLKQSLDVMNFKNKGTGKIKPRLCKKDGNTICRFIKSQYFTLQKITIKKELEVEAKRSSFTILFVLKGKGQIQYGTNRTEPISKGEFILIPAILSCYKIRGRNLEIIKIFI